MDITSVPYILMFQTHSAGNSVEKISAGVYETRMDMSLNQSQMSFDWRFLVTVKSTDNQLIGLEFVQESTDVSFSRWGLDGLPNSSWSNPSMTPGFWSVPAYEGLTTRVSVRVIYTRPPAVGLPSMQVAETFKIKAESRVNAIVVARAELNVIANMSYSW